MKSAFLMFAGALAEGRSLAFLQRGFCALLRADVPTRPPFTCSLAGSLKVTKKGDATGDISELKGDRNRCASSAGAAARRTRSCSGFRRSDGRFASPASGHLDRHAPYSRGARLPHELTGASR
jgi:hypothetical protein